MAACFALRSNTYTFLDLLDCCHLIFKAFSFHLQVTDSTKGAKWLWQQN